MNWKEEFAQAFKHPSALLAYLNLSNSHEVPQAHQQFSTLVTKSFANRMAKGDPNDPLLLQVLPVQEELLGDLGFSMDPVMEKEAKISPSFLHKYQSRVLAISTPSCAIHCRYCFRRNYPYHEGSRTFSKLLTEFHSLDLAPEVDEIILSGGDPLMLEDDQLSELLALISQKPQIKSLRIHSRLPIVLPRRIHPHFNEIFKGFSGQVIFIIHSNHPNELNQETEVALKQLRTDFHLLNQFVLLKGINDKIETLEDLCRKGFSQGVLPYYLNLLDKAQGTSHFLVSDEKARLLQKALRERLPGYLMPKFVRDIPGNNSKVPFS